MDTFCVLPWYGLNLPLLTPCCLLPKNTDITQVKHDLLVGIKSPACAKCWQVESSGEKSKRQFENELLDYKLDRDLDKIQEDCKTKSIDPLVYQIQTSNLCNQACVTCNSYLSSKWAEIERKIGTVPHPTFKIKLSNVDVDYATARRIEFVGGEPFFDPTTFQILDLLIEHNNTDCFISVVTNGSISLSDHQLNILSKFTDLNICISVDGIGPVFEYLRWPAKWPTLLDNIKKFKKITKNISISYTISSLNVLYYQQTVDWFQSQNLRYNHNIVTHPEWISLSGAPVKIKALLRDDSFVSAWAEITGKETDLAEYQQLLVKQDRAKKINIKDYLPEIWEILNDSASVGK
jgi:hypothetical protein